MLWYYPCVTKLFTIPVPYIFAGYSYYTNLEIHYKYQDDTLKEKQLKSPVHNKYH